MSDVRTLGKRLGQRVGQEAIVLGKITERTPDGKSAKITTTDDAQLNVTFPEPLDENASDYIEVRGTVKSKSTMSCSSFVCFPSSMTKDFDANSYNTMVHVHCAVSDKLDRFMEV